jgi:hypothetical protein
MASRPTRFQLEQPIRFCGQPMRVAGILQLEAPDGTYTTRYQLAEEAGASQILEHSGERLSQLRPLPPGAETPATGKTLNVMGQRYTLANVRRFRVASSAGQPPGGVPQGDFLVSGLFEGPMGGLLRELAPGTQSQRFYSVKPLLPYDVLSAEQLAIVQEGERLAAMLQAQALEEEREARRSGPLLKAAALAVVGLVVLGLVYACSADRANTRMPAQKAALVR